MSLQLFYCSPESDCYSARAGTPHGSISCRSQLGGILGQARMSAEICLRATSAASTSMAR
jgi:hypothetical protein